MKFIPTNVYKSTLIYKNDLPNKLLIWFFKGFLYLFFFKKKEILWKLFFLSMYVEILDIDALVICQKLVNFHINKDYGEAVKIQQHSLGKTRVW